MAVDAPVFKWDIFISHASEDKKEIVLPLAEELNKRGIKVWVDKTMITLGDSLRQKIDEGLVQSRYGVVILSENFFNKEWPQKELDALVSREDNREKVILPIWHKIDYSEIVKKSPIIASKMAINSNVGVSSVANEIELIVKNSFDSDSILSTEEIQTLSVAFEYTKWREGKYSNLDPITVMSHKVDKNSQLVRLKDFTKTELAVIVEALKENIRYVNNYDYGPGLEEFGRVRKIEIISPLRSMYDKLQKAIYS